MTTSSAVPMAPSKCSRIWSIINWKMSWALTRPQGRQTNLYLPHGMLNVVNNDDSKSRTMQRYDEVPLTLVSVLLPASWWVCIAIGHFCGACTTGFESFQRVMGYIPGKCPIPSNLSGYALMRSSLLLSC